MNKFNTLYLFLVFVLLSSCEFNQSISTDLVTGATSRGDGIGCDDIAITINGKIEKRNEFISGEKVNIVFNNIKGLTNIDEKTYPALSMFIIKNGEDTVSQDVNLLKDLDQGTSLSPLQLQANFRAAFPCQNNEKYMVHIIIRDKKGNGNFSYKLPFTIVENKLLNIKNKGIRYSNIYLWNETLKQPVFDEKINSKHFFILILDDIEGLDVKNEKAFPIFSIDLKDSNGDEIISSPNVLSNFEEVGVDPVDLKKQLTASIMFPKGDVSNPCKLTAKLKDKISSKEIVITAELIIE